jgi:hypothetical protein
MAEADAAVIARRGKRRRRWWGSGKGKRRWRRSWGWGHDALWKERAVERLGN